MPAWYQDAAWRILRGIRGQSLLAGYNVSARFVDPEPGDSYVLLSNHAHRLDPWVVGSLLSRTIRYMANLEGTNPAKAAFADLVGAYAQGGPGLRRPQADPGSGASRGNPGHLPRG